MKFFLKKGTQSTDDWSRKERVTNIGTVTSQHRSDLYYMDMHVCDN